MHPATSRPSSASSAYDVLHAVRRSLADGSLSDLLAAATRWFKAAKHEGSLVEDSDQYLDEAIKNYTLSLKKQVPPRLRTCRTRTQPGRHIC
eukprot:NODE_29545_length_443_cov_3.003165.p3 GENE.NODE_29545_length_443_cov_3.003165~~NODE_29545_length_443_cov_3.003165.p3  ORF type:complete len:92 (-),score=9.86 NODE_29545_length_443_cov_3.003165:35-310(-)